MTLLTVIVGGQYGSEGKGAVAGFLGRKMRSTDLAVRVAGPNAGHTVYDDKHQAWKLRSVPVAAVTSTCQLHIAAGSEIDLGVMFDEIQALDASGHRVSERLTIHPSATILTEQHIAMERGSGIVDRIGSTGKGIGAARQARITRTAVIANDIPTLQPMLSEPGPLDLHSLDRLVIEGTQGYGLGLHTANYPQVTSSDCRAIDFMAMAGVSPWDNLIHKLEVVVVARTYPIRVAGNSGPLLKETSWKALGLSEERTTVTNKVRRVGEWDRELLHEAIRANGGGNWCTEVKLAITMLDHRFPIVKDQRIPLGWGSDWETGTDRGAVLDWLTDVQDEMETDIVYVGTGPETMSEVMI